ncbi:hypothetical protein RKD37_006535 [Streptomyces ambofaciens]
MGSQSWAYQSAADTRVRDSVRLISGPSPAGVGNVPSGTAVICRLDGFQVVPSKSSRDTMRRYRPDRSSESVWTERTWRSSSTLRLSRRETSGFTAEIVPPPPVPEPTPLRALSSSPPSIAGRASGTTRAMPSAKAPMRRPVRTGARARPCSEPGARAEPPKTRPHCESRSRPSASSSTR